MFYKTQRNTSEILKSFQDTFNSLSNRLEEIIDQEDDLHGKLKELKAEKQQNLKAANIIGQFFKE